MTKRHKDIAEILEHGGCLDDIATVAGCIASHGLSLNMPIETLRARLLALPYIADMDAHIFCMVILFLRSREKAKASR